MSYYADESDADRYDTEGADAHEFDVYITKLLRDYDDAHAALKTLTPGMCRSERWRILDRVYQTAMALEIEQTRNSYQAINAQAMDGLRGHA